jgi:hypothetical protein
MANPLAKTNLKSKLTKEDILNQKKYIKAKNEFKEKFYRLMFELGLYNKFNKTYFLQIMNETNYGFYAQLYLVDGLSFKQLQQKIGELQEGLCCIWIMQTKQFENYASVKIVTQPLDENLPFENPKIKPHQMYLGMSFSMKPIIIDVVLNCMMLCGGATNKGKTRWIYCVLLSWILGCKPSEVELYISDIAKDEYVLFKNVKHVKCYANELEQLYNMVHELKRKFEERKVLISKYRETGEATNIWEYNLISKNKLSYVYYVIDELSVLMPDKTDSEDEKDMKGEILAISKMLEKTARALGIYVLCATQKTTKEEMPSIIKNMSAVRVSFGANDAVSSEVIMGDSSAVGLQQRYAVYSLNGGEKKDYLFSPYLTTDMLKMLLEPYKTNKTELNKPNPIKEIPTIETLDLPKQMIPYNQNSNYTLQPIIWKLDAKFRPYKKQDVEIVEMPKPLFHNNGDDDCIDY